MKVIIVFLFVVLTGCIVNSNPHKSFEYNTNFLVERQAKITDYPYNQALKYLTHKTKDKNNNIIYHLLEQDWKTGLYKGQCRTYFVVDPKTYIIIDWGYDEGGNPNSCVATG